MKKGQTRSLIPPSATSKRFSALRGCWQAWNQFWFTPVDPVGLHGIRLLSGLLFAFWLLTFLGHQEAFFGLQGWFDYQAYQNLGELPANSIPPIGWSILYLGGTDLAWLNAMYWISIGVFLLFALGIWPRITGILTWVMVSSFITNPVLSYGADFLLIVLAFYLMLGYLFLGQWSHPQSTLSRFVGHNQLWPTDLRFSAQLLKAKKEEAKDEEEEPPPEETPDEEEPSYEPAKSYAANITLRLLQVHFAIIVFVSALHKFQNGDWWSGVAFWYPMHSPFSTSFGDIQTSTFIGTAYLFFWSLLQYAVLAWQIGFPLFAWRKSWRKVLLAGGVLGWLGSVFILKQPLFGPVYLIGCLCYLSPTEWHTGWARLGRVLRLIKDKKQTKPTTSLGRTTKLTTASNGTEIIAKK